MKSIQRALPAACTFTVLQLALMQAYAAPLTISNVPLFLTTANKANILMMYGNSNSMDSDATGRAVGSTAPNSKSEISRLAIRNLIDNYTGYVNMGLMAYKQYPAVIKKLHDAQYDVSYNSANYDPNHNGPRNGVKKKFRVEVPAGSGHYVYYNVNLPGYYDAEYATEFCYSSTACTSPTYDFMGKGGNCSVRETLPPGVAGSGPWDQYACHSGHTGNTANADRAHNDNGGYSGYRNSPRYHPTDADLGQGITDFGKRMAGQFVSDAWFNNAAPGPGYLHVPIALLDAAQVPKLKAKLGITQYANNKPVDPAFALQNSGLSPLSGTVITAKNYFNGTLTDTSQGGSNPSPPVPNSCRKNFMVTLTDGLPSVTATGVASANTAAMLSELTTEVGLLKNSAAQVETYVVGFALPYGVSITQLDSIAAAGGSGTAYYADDQATLDATFKRIFVDIMSKTSAASAVALNSHSVTIGGHVFQARFSSGDWSGQLLKLALREVEVDGATYMTLDQQAPVWDASDKVDEQASNNTRTIITRKSNNRGIPFRWPTGATPNADKLDSAQMAALNRNAQDAVDGLGSARLDYLRGSAANEGVAGHKFRARPTSKLGDIVNSAPAYVGVPDQNYGLPGHIEYRALHQNRPGMLYVGANDGMLHGFDMATGAERLAYVPSSVFSNLSKLTSPLYSHRYFVDGTPATSDVEFGPNDWHTVLVSGMGGGARGVFGLDISDPTAFSEAAAASIVKFEYTDANDSDIGFIPGPVTIAKLNNGRWAAVFGNGYNSSGNSNNGDAYLFVVDVETGARIAKIKAELAASGGGPRPVVTSPNGLAPPMLIDLDGNDTADVAYAGDLLGNMWKFNLKAAGPGSWGVSYKLFQAPQPITAMPDVGEHPEAGFMVYFGTGKYIEPTDVSAPAANAAVNAMYGIQDLGAPASAQTVTEADLVLQEVTSLPGPLAGGRFRKASVNEVNYANRRGWKLAFPNNVERAVSRPALRDGRLAFTSITPNNAECSTGGTSVFYQLDWLTGGEPAKRQFDTNGDRLHDANDELVAGMEKDGVLSGAAVQDFTKSEGNFFNGSEGKVELIDTALDGKRTRRLSWKQLKK